MVLGSKGGLITKPKIILKESGARNLGNGILGSFLDQFNDLRCETYFG